MTVTPTQHSQVSEWAMSPPSNSRSPKRKRCSILSRSKNSSLQICLSLRMRQKISVNRWRKMDFRHCLRGQKMQPLWLVTRIWLRSTIETSIILLTKTGVIFKKESLRVHWASGSNLCDQSWKLIFCKAMTSNHCCWRKSFLISIHQEIAAKWTLETLSIGQETVSPWSKTLEHLFHLSPKKNLGWLKSNHRIKTHSYFQKSESRSEEIHY
jgi:hypothetical protein